MKKLACRLLMSVVLISPVVMHSVENKGDIACSKNVAVQERCFTLGQTMADLVAHMTIEHVKIAGTDKTKQERLAYLWGKEILKGLETEINSALGAAHTDFSSEQVDILKARFEESKKSFLALPLPELAKQVVSQITQVPISDEEKKSFEITYAFGTTLAQVYWLLSTTVLTLADQAKAQEVAKTMMLRLIAGVSTQLESCTQKEFLEKHQLNKEQEQEYTTLIGQIIFLLDSAPAVFLPKADQFIK